MPGAQFLERYGGITDTATVVRPERRYPVRRAAEHPVGEQARELFDDAQKLLREIAEKDSMIARGVFGLWPATSTAGN